MENLKDKVRAEKETGIEEEKSESIPVFVVCGESIDARARRH